MKPSRREREGGFALLLVFLMAAAVAFTIYHELPRAAFESARDKEQLLLDRGNQYKRAIEVYYAVNKRYPPEIKDLEESNQKRYLRHRYKDPLTGEDEWRIIHTNGSFLTDSLVQKPPARNAANVGPGAPTVGGGPLGLNTMNTAPAQPAQPDTANGGAPAVNAAIQRRPSDRTITAEGFPQPGNAGAPGAFAGNAGGNSAGGGNPGVGSPFGTTANYDPNDPRTWPAITLTPANPAPAPQGNPGQPGQPPNAQIAAGQIGAGQAGAGSNAPSQPPFPPQGFQNPFGPGQVGSGQANQFNPNQASPFNSNASGQFSPNSAAQFNPNRPGQFNQAQFNPNPASSFNAPPFGGGQPAPQINQPAGAGFSPQGGIGGQPSPAGGLTPANGGNAALQAINDQLFRPAQVAGGGPGGAMGSPGIAGVASKREGPSIKSYRDRTKYQEWEFVFDASARTGPQAGAPGQNPAGQGALGGSPLGQNPLGANPAGAGPFGQPQPGQAPPGQNQPGQGQPNGGFPPGFVNPFSQPGASQGR